MQKGYGKYKIVVIFEQWSATLLRLSSSKAQILLTVEPFEQWRDLLQEHCLHSRGDILRGIVRSSHRQNSIRSDNVPLRVSSLQQINIYYQKNNTL